MRVKQGAPGGSPLAGQGAETEEPASSAFSMPEVEVLEVEVLEVEVLEVLEVPVAPVRPPGSGQRIGPMGPGRP